MDKNFLLEYKNRYVCTKMRTSFGDARKRSCINSRAWGVLESVPHRHPTIADMQSCTFIILAAVVALALAEGQFYVPRAYYIIDSEGHESPPVPLRRLRRSLGAMAPYPYHPGSRATASANANAGDHATANANAVSGVYPSRRGGHSELSGPNEFGTWSRPGWN